MSMSRSQFVQVFEEGSTVVEATERPKFVFCGTDANDDAIDEYEAARGSGSPRISKTALSVKTSCFTAGIMTGHLHTGHLPDLPAFDSFAVRLCPLGHLM